MTASAAMSLEPMTVNVAQAARLIGAGKTFVWEHVHSGKLPSTKVGRRTFVSIEALKELVNVQPPRPRVEVMLLNMEDAAGALSISRSMVRRLVAQGKLQQVRIRRSVRVTVESVRAIASGRVAA